LTDRLRDPQAESWQGFVQTIRQSPAIPFEDQWARYNEIFADRDPALPPPPAWAPETDRLEHANLTAVMRELGIDDYRAFHRWTCDNRDDFWGLVVERLGIVFSRQPDQVLDLAAGPAQPRWLPGADLNIVSSCFPEEGFDIAVVVGREGSREMEAVTYEELDMLVSLVANGLAAAGFAPGDAIALYMPMNLECVAAYLGIIRAGCAVVSIADSFAAPEVARRLEISEAAAIITVSSFQRGGRSIELFQTVREAGATRAIVIAAEGFSEESLRDGDLLWWDFLSDATDFEALTGTPNTVTNILFSSGTTGDPKAIPWTHLTPIKCAMDGHFHHDIQRGDVVAWPTNIGWMMGPWLIRSWVHGVRPQRWGRHARCRAVAGARVARLRRLRRRRLVENQRPELDRRTFQPPRLSVAHESHRLPRAGHRVLRRHRDRRRPHHGHRRPAGIAGELHDPSARTGFGDTRRSRSIGCGW
jgi:acetyl-CoA synthetase